MSKKIVVITGSPRKNGNSFAMTDSFIDSAIEKGHAVTRFDAAMMKIGGCHACETCYKTGKACSFDDDFNTIAPAVLEADAIVFTMPVYWYSIPSQIKGVIDKIYSLVIGGKDISGKECALIACCEEDDLSVLDGVRIPMERTAALNKWNMVGEVLVPGVLKTTTPFSVHRSMGMLLYPTPARAMPSRLLLNSIFRQSALRTMMPFGSSISLPTS